MAAKSAVQKLIDDYEAAIQFHKGQIASKQEFLEALYATKKAKARIKRSGKPPAHDTPGER